MVDNSARAFADGQLLYPPYSHLGWVQWADPLEGMAASDMAQARNEKLPLVIFSQRSSLNINLNHCKAVDFITSAVTSHLHICITANKQSSILHREGNVDTFLEVLNDKVLTGMVNIGKYGELASWLLWLLAKDLYPQMGKSGMLS
ncbi:hypothetical protein EDC04DRAFT_2605604 [Pisolithus marmoratus]|nr:hypothetical protein EDC04DRAFT_2605604 [Pisolithus marmoratus]